MPRGGFEGGDGFWQTCQTHEGRKFYLVEPPRRSKTPLFDRAKMAATLAINAKPIETPKTTTPPMWMSDSPAKLYITRQSRDLKKLVVCLANPDSGEVKALVEERLNTYIETKPLRLVNSRQDLVFWSERTGWGHYCPYDANTGALKNAITSGEFVVTGLDEKPAPVM